MLYAVPLKVDDHRIVNANSRARSVRDNLARANGISGAILADGLPLDNRDHGARTALQPELNEAAKFVHAQATRVDNDYLKTMGIPLLRGRGFAADDRAGTELVTIISKALAEKLFPNAEAGQAIGKRFIFGNDEKTTQTLTVVVSAAISRPRK